MTTKKLTKLLALYLPYILLGLVATNFGEAWRLAEGKELGDKIMSMKKLGMLIVQDQVWGRVTANRSSGKSTRYYMDEMHLLLKEEQTAAYSVEFGSGSENGAECRLD